MEILEPELWRLEARLRTDEFASIASARECVESLSLAPRALFLAWEECLEECLLPPCLLGLLEPLPSPRSRDLEVDGKRVYFSRPRFQLRMDCAMGGPELRLFLLPPRASFREELCPR